MFVNLVCPPKLTNIPPCCVFLIQTIDGKCIFSHSLAKLAHMVQDKQMTYIPPPPAVGGSAMFHALVPATQSCRLIILLDHQLITKT